MSLAKHLRLIPAVILVGGGLLILKGTDLVRDARAQTALTGQAPAPEPQTATQVAVVDPTIDDSQSNSAAEVDVLTSLSKRRQALDAREQSLNMQANLIAAAEKRVDDKIAGLKNLQTQMQTLLGQRDGAEQAQLNTLVKSYSSMKPADAARIFNSLDDKVQLNVAAQMKSDVLGAILAKMQADAAQDLTVRLANRLKAPAPLPVPPPAPATAAQMPAVDPATQSAAATPAPAPPPAAQPAQQSASAPAPTAADAVKSAVTPPPAAPKQQAASAPIPQAAKPAPNDPKQQAATPPAKPAAPAPVKAKSG